MLNGNFLSLGGSKLNKSNSPLEFCTAGEKYVSFCSEILDSKLVPHTGGNYSTVDRAPEKIGKNKHCFKYYLHRSIKQKHFLISPLHYQHLKSKRTESIGN
jgi:hypothetical protein